MPWIRFYIFRALHIDACIIARRRITPSICSFPNCVCWFYGSTTRIEKLSDVGTLVSRSYHYQ